MIVNVRGTSGSGKSTIARAVLKDAQGRPVYGALGPKYPEAYLTNGWASSLALIGPYSVPTGGCDIVVGALGVEGVIALLEKYSKLGHVLFEGLILSSMWGAVGKWLEQHKADVILAPIKVSLEECQAGLRDRQTRERAAKTQEAHYKGTMRVVKRAALDGFRVEWLKRDGAVNQIRGWLE